MRRHRSGTLVLCALLWLPMLWWLAGCAPGTLPPGHQRVVDVLCERDMALQPVVVPVVLMVAPAAGPAGVAVAGAVAVDLLLIHPGIVAACAAYASRPAEVVSVVPPGAVVAAPVAVTVTPAP